VFSEVRVGLGSARVALDGHISERMDLRFAGLRRGPELLAPGTRGELKASGTVRGTLTDPAIVVTAHAGLRLPGDQARELRRGGQF